MHDSCINYANMLTLYTSYRDNSWYQGKKKYNRLCKELVSLAQKIFNKVDQKRDRCFSVKFVKSLRRPFLWNTYSGGFYFFKNCRFLFLFSDENNLAKLSFDMWGNCSNKLWYRLETCNSFLKSLQYRCFPLNFAKFLTSFLQNTSGQLLLGLFIHFTVLSPGELIETSLFLFLDIIYHGIRTWWISWI